MLSHSYAHAEHSHTHTHTSLVSPVCWETGAGWFHTWFAYTAHTYKNTHTHTQNSEQCLAGLKEMPHD